jgi:hypothetical protein|tara:strand:+ start:407 stop:1009 length:603 start_codon:yes stop_codon:yes gene_type:complete
MNAKPILLIASLFLASSLQATDVSITPFVSGEAATAESVNTAFETLISVINENNQRLAALETHETGDVAGRSYKLVQMGSILRSDNIGGVTIGNSSQNYTVVLNSDSTFSVDGSVSESEVDTTHGSITSFSDPVSITGTFTQSGQDVTFSSSDADGGTVTFFVSPDGDVMVTNEFEYGEEEDLPSWVRGETSFMIGIEIK